MKIKQPNSIYRYCLSVPREVAKSMRVGDAIEINCPMGKIRRTLIVAAIAGKQSLSRVYLRPL